MSVWVRLFDVRETIEVQSCQRVTMCQCKMSEIEVIVSQKVSELVSQNFLQIKICCLASVKRPAFLS